MQSRTSTPRTIVGVLALLATCPVLAQEPPPPKPSIVSMINVDALIDNYARFLARKYDLNADQDAFTQQLIRDKANSFMGKHRDELYSLVDRLFEVRGSGAEMSQQELIDWGRRALPLYQEAKGIIVTSNDQWRQILNENQRRIHDEDVQLMNSSFQMTEDQLNRIVTGQMTVDEFRRGNRQTPGASSPKPGTAQGGASQSPPAKSGNTAAVPGGPGASSGNPGETVVTGPGTAAPGNDATGPRGPRDRGRGRQGGPGRRGDRQGPPPPPGTGVAPGPGPGPGRATTKPAAPAVPETQWESYVRGFIEKYKLNDEQAQRARAILKDCQEQADNYTLKHQAEMAELDKKIAAASASGGNARELPDLNQRKIKLMEPVGQIFEQQLKPRLEKLPTRAQRQAAEGGKKPAGTSGGKGGTPQPQPPAKPPQPPAPPDQPQEPPESPEAP